MTFEEWYEHTTITLVGSSDSIRKQLIKAAWDAGHNEGFKDYRDKLEGGLYVLVPVEPTLDMIEAIENALLDMGPTLKVVDIYNAMIQAAQEE